MRECKKALVETGGNIDKAFDYLRKAGAAKALKKEGREAKEGVVLSYIHPGAKLGVLLELNFETDLSLIKITAIFVQAVWMPNK